MIIGYIAFILLSTIIILSCFIPKNKQPCDFYCQRDIEGELPCEEQCEHCKEYYKPLNNEL